MKALMLIFAMFLSIMMFGETLNKHEVYLSKDKSKVSLVEITETNEGNRTTIVADTIKNLYPSENAKAYMTQKNAEILMNESPIWLPDSLIPRKTHLFGKDRYERYSLEVTGDKIFRHFKGYYYKPINIRRFYCWTAFSIMFLLVSLWGCFTAKNKGMIHNVRQTTYVIFFMCFVLSLSTSTFTLVDSFAFSSIITLPSFIATFLLNKKIRRLELKK